MPFGWIPHWLEQRRKNGRALPVVIGHDPAYADVLKPAIEEMYQRLYEAGVPIQIGVQDVMDKMLAEILREKYGLEWRPEKPAKSQR